MPFIAFVALSLTSVFTTFTFVNIAKTSSTLIYQKVHATRSHIVKPLESYCTYPYSTSNVCVYLTCFTLAFIGDDHPRRLPIEQKFIKMTVQESVHFDITAPESQAEWLWTASAGDGHVRIGQDKHMFAVAMFHELHCLRAIRGVIENGWDTITHERQGHLLHCFNYIRQYILCAADTTLEPGDFTKRNFTTSRVGATHTCVDWEPLYVMMKEKWDEWDGFRIAHGFPEHNEVT